MSPLQEILERLNQAYFRSAPLHAEDSGRVAARFRGNRISSVFQPILSASDGSTVGHAARVRADRDGQPAVSHWAVMAVTGPAALVVELDRLCRTLHALNYFPQAHPSWRLFLRVHSRLVETVGSGHGRVFEGILGLMGVPTRAVVIEISRDTNEDPALFTRAVLSYRSLGYKVACDCLDEDDPLLSGRYDVVPDVIALDHRWVPGEDALAGLVRRIQALGAQPLITRIESPDCLATARRAAGSLLQGFHLGMPLPVPALAADEISAGTVRSAVSR